MRKRRIFGSSNRLRGAAAACCAAVALLSLVGCRLNRYTIEEPVTDRVFEVRSGDRWRVELDDPEPDLTAWSAACRDDHVEVTYERLPAETECGRTVVPAKCVATVRVHRGFGGPAEVTLRCRNRRTGKTVRRVTLGLYSRTGDFAPWK